MVGAVGIVLVLGTPATAPGSKAHHYRAEVELEVSESYTLRDGALPSPADPCANVGWGARQVRWQASIGKVKYVRAGKREALRSNSGRTRFAPFAAVMEVSGRDAGGSFSPPGCEGLPGASPGSPVGKSCLRKLTGRALELGLSGVVRKKRFRIRNRGPRMPKNHRRQCGPSFRDQRVFDGKDVRFDDTRAIFDGFRLKASSKDVRRLRRGRSVRMNGRVRLKNAVQDCCVGIGAPSVGAIWDVTARAAIRLVPRGSGAGGGGGGGGGGGNGDGGGGGGGRNQGGSGDSPGGGGCDISGTNRSDLLIGTNGDDQICGFGGNDVLIGRGGNDSIRGGSGADRIEGGLGNDIIQGEGGADDINAGDGDDIVSSDEGSDTIAGGSGADKLFGNAGVDTIRGGTGNDDLFGGAGNDFLYGEGGDDGLSGMTGWDFMDGGSGLNGCIDDGPAKNTYINCGKGED